ncbi:CHAP domain-containing protein [Solicola sp. PLA-1-18]|uniref:CHAP domain-containing protein n=1 Tax=Solicola sp. PLA-1-18 TaxID=3380532 RepID=UPI003B774A44
MPRPRRHALTAAVAVLAGVVMVLGPAATAPASAATTPKLTSFSPRTGETTGGTRVVVKGKRFSSSVKVWFGSTRATKVKRLSSTKVVAWSPEVASARSVRLKLRTRGVTVRSTKTFAYRATTTRQVPDLVDLGTDRLVPGASLLRGQSLTSATGAYRVGLRADGVLLLVPRSGAVRQVAGVPAGTSLQMRPDGALVAIGTAGQVVWSSGTGTPGAELVVHDDGSLTVSAGDTVLWRAALLVAPVRGDDYPASLRAAARTSVVDPWRFYNRECTSFVAWRMNQVNQVAFTNFMTGPNGTAGRWSNAGTWGTNARKIGYRVDKVPAVGSIAWYSGRHVAWVSRVNADGTVLLEEYNWSNPGGYGSRTATVSAISGFIHVKDL